MRPDYGVRSRCAQANDEPRLHDTKFRIKPRFTSNNLRGRRFLVDSALTALFEFEMFHGVGDIDVCAVNSSIGEGAVQKRTRRSDKGASSQILSIAGLLSDQHNPRSDRTFSQNRLSGSPI